MKQFLIAVLIISTSFSLRNASGKEEALTIGLYPLPESIESTQILRPDDTSLKLEKGTYSLKAHLSLKTKKSLVVFDSLNLDIEDSAYPQHLPNSPGWSMSEKAYRWEPGIPDDELTVSIRPPSFDITNPLTHFSHLQVDYMDFFPDNPSLMSLEVGYRSKASGKTLFAGSWYQNPVLAISQEIYPEDLKKKDWVYLAKRKADLPHDLKWRYSSSVSKTVLQRRFNLNMKNMEELQLHFSNKTEIEDIMVTLRVGFGERFRPQSVLMWEELPVLPIMELPNQKILKINIHELLNNRYFWEKKVFLKEIVVFFPNSRTEIITGDFLKKISFFKASKPRKPFNLILPSQIKTLSLQKKRLTVDLRALMERVDWNANLTSLKLRVFPKSIYSASGLEIQSAQLATLVGTKTPAYIETIQELSHRWGGPFLDLTDPSKTIEWIKILAYRPFGSALGTKNKRIKSKSPPNDQKRNNESDKPSSILRDQTTSKNIGNLTFTAGFPLPRIKIESDRLVLEGIRTAKENENWIEIVWPLKTKINRDTRFYLNIPGGEHSHITSLKLTPVANGKKLSSVDFPVNRSVQFLDGPKFIDKLKIRIHIRNGSFKIALKEMTLFEPMSIDKMNALDYPFLTKQQIFFVPSGTNLFQSREALFQGTANYQQLSGSLEINRKVEWIRGLKLKYDFPSSLPEDRMSCWLKLWFQEAKRNFEKTLCLKGHSGEIVVSRKELFENTKLQPEDIIENIRWQVLSNAFRDSDSPFRDEVNLKMWLQGVDVRPLRFDFNNHPLMRLGRKYIFPRSLNKVSTEEFLKGGAFIDLGTLTLEEDLQRDVPVEFLDHPFLQTTGIFFEKSQPFSFAALGVRPGTQETQKADSFSSRILSILIKVMAAYLIFVIICWVIQKPFVVRLWDNFWDFFSSSSINSVKPWKWVITVSLIVGLTGFALKNIVVTVLFFYIALFAAFLLAIRTRRPYLEDRWPTLAAKLYEGAGTQFITGFILFIVLSGFFLTFNQIEIAELTAAVAYGMLIAGVFLEARELIKRNRNRAMKKSRGVSVNEGPRA